MTGPDTCVAGARVTAGGGMGWAGLGDFLTDAAGPISWRRVVTGAGRDGGLLRATAAPAATTPPPPGHPAQKYTKMDEKFASKILSLARIWWFGPLSGAVIAVGECLRVSLLSLIPFYSQDSRTLLECASLSCTIFPISRRSV